MTSTYTEAQIQALKDAISQGTLKVEYSDKKVTFRSLAEMRQTLALMQNELHPGTARPTRRYAQFSKGLDGSI